MIPKDSRRNFSIFMAIAIVLIAQLFWWATVFIGDVDKINALSLENATLRTRLGETVIFPPTSLRESSRRRFMFLSESITFGLLCMLGLFLLFISMRSEIRSKEALRNFIEVFNHDSKTPLTALKLRLESLLEGVKDKTAIRLALDEIRRLCAIHDRTMNLSRLERSVLNFDLLDFSEMVEQVIRSTEPLFRSRNVNCKASVSRDIMVQGDLYSLQSSVQALLENAILYNESDRKELSVVLIADNGGAHLEVSDNGPGIPARDRPYIFEQYYRGQRHRNVPGTGLGLSLAKKILEAHRGTIELLPDREDRMGSSFRISLPSRASV